MSSPKDPNPMPENPTKLPEPDAMGTNAAKPKEEPAEEHDDKGKPAEKKVGKDKDKATHEPALPKEVSHEPKRKK